MRRSALFAVTTFALVAACHRPPAAAPAPRLTASAPAPFALVVERSASGWRARCEQGCRWAEVTMTCAGCAVRVDASGIAGADAPAADGDTGFAFVLSAAEGGWTARAVRGVRWVALSRTCGGAVCRGRLDEGGVSGA